MLCIASTYYVDDFCHQGDVLPTRNYRAATPGEWSHHGGATCTRILTHRTYGESLGFWRADVRGDFDGSWFLGFFGWTNWTKEFILEVQIRGVDWLMKVLDKNPIKGGWRDRTVETGEPFKSWKVMHMWMETTASEEKGRLNAFNL